MPDFLLELGLEEVPARMIASAQAELLKRTLALLTREQLISADPTAHAYSTPRRLAVLVRDVLTQQPDITEETTGPAIKIAFKDGVPTPAAEAFARKSGIPVADLRTITTPKGDYLAATTLKRGRTTAEVLATELPKEIAALYWAKNMRWIPGGNEKFVRPILWLVCLLGEEIVPVTFAGRTAGRATYGHRVLSTGEPFEIQTPDSYLAQLEGEHVLADVELRRQKIRKALDKVTREIPNARWREDEPLVDSVTHLTEWPDVLLGNFEAAYLTLPEEVLVTVMRDHQKYFAVEDAQGKLAPHFLTVTNIALTAENTPIIRQGNERVLRARFNDARFFWEFDQRTPLAARVKQLENVTFQKDLGTYYEKTQRIRDLAAQLLDQSIILSGEDDLKQAVDRAALLSKTDLTTEMVKEFTELQGIVGGLYAKYQGEHEAVAEAVYDQYKPQNVNGEVPRTTVGDIVAIADKMSNIVDMFAIGLEPTGSKDPFALRRAGNGTIKILAEGKVGKYLDVQSVLWAAIRTSQKQDEARNCRAKILSFMRDRFEFYLRQRCGISPDIAKVILGGGLMLKPNENDQHSSLSNTVAFAQTLNNLRSTSEVRAISLVFKRMGKILQQAQEAGDILTMSLSRANLKEPAEIDLLAYVNELETTSRELYESDRYEELISRIAAMEQPLSNFFESLMVMDPDPEIRRKRLSLLQFAESIVRQYGDFSEIVVES
jgi:glycyl-tRNA synthetase beta chain